jgi:hypothetical protein
MVVFRRDGVTGEGRDFGGGIWFRKMLWVVGSTGLVMSYGWGFNLMGKKIHRGEYYWRGKMHKWRKINGGS